MQDAKTMVSESPTTLRHSSDLENEALEAKVRRREEGKARSEILGRRDATSLEYSPDQQWVQKDHWPSEPRSYLSTA